MQQKIIFMGTPQFSVPILETLAKSSYQISCVYTQPPKKSNRGLRLNSSPIELSSKNLKLVVNNSNKQIEEKYFFEKNELKIILDLYAQMVSEGSWKDYGLSISSRQVGFSVFKNAAENALYKICKNFKPNNKNLKYLITDSNGKVLKNSFDLKVLLKNTNWKKLKK